MGSGSGIRMELAVVGRGPVVRVRYLGLTAALLALAAAACVAPAGCEAEDPAAAPGPSGGVGPSTLLVRANIVATGRVTNAATPDDFDTTVSVRVERDGAVVPDAIVSLRRSDREAPDVLLPSEDDGRYVGDHVGYVPAYELSVEAGPDTLDGVRIELPAVHAVTAPAPAARVPAGNPLAVTWDALDAADRVTVSLGAAQTVLPDDPGTAELPAAALAALVADGAEVDRPLTVTREVRLALEGGAAGSRAFAAVTNGLGAVTVVP